MFLSATRKRGALDAILQGQPVINALLRSPAPPPQLTVNGRNVTPDFRADAQAVWRPP